MSSNAETCVSDPLLFTTEQDGVLAHLRYDPRDPLAVQLRFAAGPTWSLLRDALDPLIAPEPVPGADVEAHWSDDALRLSLHGPDGRSVTLVLDADDPVLCEFLATTYDLVPAGTEHTRLDGQWDRLLTGGGAP